MRRPAPLPIPLLTALAAALAAGCSSAPPPPDPGLTRTPATASAPAPADAATLAERLAYGSRTRTKLPPAYLHERLRERAATPAVDAAFERVRADDTPANRSALLHALERGFVHAETTSSLDLLGPELGQRFRSFNWHDDDYPGGPVGPNEHWAGTLADALDGVSPERRANRSAVAALRREEATEPIWERLLAAWRPIPGEEGHRLNRHAVGPYLAMREAAAADGVELVIVSAHRDPRRARANAARAANPFAVASFSSHALGLAIDLALPIPGGPAGDAAAFPLSTRPMARVVDMRRSPVHKWMHLHASGFGWYPYQHEPWHWEYNPPGFRAVLLEDLGGGPSPRGAPPASPG
ncbi:M15 family metallopeptidase domain-containing protein [Phycisphaera mikurensis]|uniref:Uncharacterized protein n=1 Tax=Phycisphaera mikurensis (strain NBRC 102666 / KCTC 22515 / FYK2301M01) TaxID=1142394 RepID=I0IDY1_PHYMF|nr:D-alanyl-D-alanine carboxypeptidase family protein [Phycisphaera mikurensis]MBB6441276.1 hypothetical protein [Phycisphaera mikurensis]BAM03469.1 hypothetical protein PSMK_13100 [Phycisphaera mikurensis NBRC 102666]